MRPLALGAMAMLTVLAFAGGALAGGEPAAAGAPPISKTQVRALTPAETTARVMDQLGDILILAPKPPPSGHKPVRPLRDLDFATAPRATYIPGVCARDDVIVTFEPVGDVAQGPDTPVRASSLSARTRYRLLGPPAREADNYGAPPASAHQACGRLAQDAVAFFNAPTAEVALSGAWWLTQLAKAPNKTAIDCKPAEATPLACATVLRGLTLDDLKSVEPCSDDHRGGEPLNCWALSVWPENGLYDLRIFTTRGQGAAIARVEMVEQVYTADATAD